MELRDLLQNLQIEPSNCQVAATLGLDRRTVGHYREWAIAQQLLEGPLPPQEELHALVETTLRKPLPPQNISSLAAYRAVIVRLREEGVEIAAIRERLKSSSSPASVTVPKAGSAWNRR